VHVSYSGITDLRGSAPGHLLAEIKLDCAAPATIGWLPPGAARPPERRKEESLLDLRELDRQIQLSLWHVDGGLLWRETTVTRDEAEAMAERLFGIKPEQWQAPSTPPVSAAQRSFQVNVTRLTSEGNHAFVIGILLFSIVMMGGMFGSMALGERLALSEGWQTSLMVVATLFSMILALLVGFGLPFWLQTRFFGKDEFNAITRLGLGPDGIHLPPLGHLSWAALNAIDQVNTEDGEAEAVILLSDAWGKLMFRATGSNSNVTLAGKLLDTLLTFWRPDEVPAGNDDPLKIFRLLPIRRWWHEILYFMGGIVGIGVFFAMMTAGNRSFLVTIAASLLNAVLTWALVALMPGHFWSLTSANRARVFSLQGEQLIDRNGNTRIDLSRAKIELVHWRRPLLELDYLCIRSPDHPTLRLAAFDNAWDEFIAAVRAVAGHWKESPLKHSTLPEDMRDLRD